MDVYYGFESLRSFRNPVVTIGSYDGVHNGHKEIIRHINSIANNIDGESVIITFAPHPREVLFNNPVKLLTTLDEKIDLLESQNVDVLIVIPFTVEFGEIEPYDFVKKILFEKIRVCKLVIGYNHHFGRGNKGDIELLRSLQPEFNFEVMQIPQYSIDSNNISSTTLRSALIEGRMDDVNRYIGYQYFIYCEVTESGYISMNNKNKLIPPAGEYNVIITHDNNTCKTTLTISPEGELKVKKTCCKWLQNRIIINFI